MLTEDYLMRMINQALAALLIALGLKKAGRYNEALQTYDQAIKSLLGLEAHLVEQLDDRVLLEKLTFLGKIEIDRLVVLADIYREEAEVHSLQAQPEKTRFAEQRSLRLYLEAVLANKVDPDLELIQKIEGLRQKTNANSLPIETRLALLDYLERLISSSDNFLAAASLSRPELMADFSSLDSTELH